MDLKRPGKTMWMCTGIIFVVQAILSCSPFPATPRYPGWTTHTTSTIRRDMNQSPVYHATTVSTYSPSGFLKPGLRIRSIFADPDPANQNFKNRIRILLALAKNQFKHLIFFHIKHISFYIWMMIIFIWKNGKIPLKKCETSIFKIFYPCLYNFTLSKNQ